MWTLLGINQSKIGGGKRRKQKKRKAKNREETARTPKTFCLVSFLVNISTSLEGLDG